MVGIGAGDLHRLVPDGRLQARFGLPVELDEVHLVRRVDHLEGVDAEALHRREGGGQGPVAHRPHDHVGRFGHQADEVPEGVVRGRGLRIAGLRLHLGGVDQVRKLDRVLDEEDWDVVADQVPIALGRVEFDREAAHVARRVDRSGAARDGRETREHRCPRALPEQCRFRDVGNIVGRLEEAVRGRAASMDDALGNAFMIEVEDLLAQDEVLEQHGAARTRLELILIVGNPDALVGGQDGVVGRLLVRLVAIAARGLERIIVRHVRSPCDCVEKTGFAANARRAERRPYRARKADISVA